MGTKTAIKPNFFSNNQVVELMCLMDLSNECRIDHKYMNLNLDQNNQWIDFTYLNFCVTKIFFFFADSP
jgi:hypothetical protein